MNILEIEDMIKGLPDMALRKEATQPTGRVPQFLVISEIKRRSDMRKRFQERQPQGTIKDQIVNEGIAAMCYGCCPDNSNERRGQDSVL